MGSNMQMQWYLTQVLVDLYSITLAKFELCLLQITFLYGSELQLASEDICAGFGRWKWSSSHCTMRMVRGIYCHIHCHFSAWSLCWHGAAPSPLVPHLFPALLSHIFQFWSSYAVGSTITRWQLLFQVIFMIKVGGLQSWILCYLMGSSVSSLSYFMSVILLTSYLPAVSDWSLVPEEPSIQFVICSHKCRKVNFNNIA